MKNPKALINPEALFLSVSEVGKLFSPQVSRQTVSRLIKSGKLPMHRIPLGSQNFYYKPQAIQCILDLSKTNMKYDLDPTV